MEPWPWLVLVTKEDSICLFSVISGLKIEVGLERMLGLVPRIELSLVLLLKVDMEMWPEPGVA